MGEDCGREQRARRGGKAVSALRAVAGAQGTLARPLCLDGEVSGMGYRLRFGALALNTSGKVVEPGRQRDVPIIALVRGGLPPCQTWPRSCALHWYGGPR